MIAGNLPEFRGAGASPATPANRSAVWKTAGSPPVAPRNSAARTGPKPGMLNSVWACRCSVSFSLISASRGGPGFDDSRSRQQDGIDHPRAKQTTKRGGPGAWPKSPLTWRRAMIGPGTRKPTPSGNGSWASGSTPNASTTAGTSSPESRIKAQHASSRMAYRNGPGPQVWGL